MDLIKIDDLKTLKCWKRLEEVEREAITTATRNSVGWLRSLTGLLSILGSMMALMGPAIFIGLHLAEIGHAVIGVFIALFGGFMAPMFACIACINRYLDSPDRLLLPHLFEPQAKAFFLVNQGRRQRLLSDAAAFDEALDAFRALPAAPEEDDIRSEAVANLVLRRRNLEADITAYFSEFRSATKEDRQRVAAIEDARGKPRHPDKRRLAEFKGKVYRLARLEESLAALPETAEAGSTVDVSLFVAAQRFREELEEERAALVARGLKPKKLPPLLADRDALKKLLPAST